MTQCRSLVYDAYELKPPTVGEKQWQFRTGPGASNCLNENLVKIKLNKFSGSFSPSLVLPGYANWRYSQ